MAGVAATFSPARDNAAW